MKTKTHRNYFYGTLARPLSALIALALFAAIPCFAQGPFIAPLTNLQTLAITASRILGVVALVWGGLRITMGDHRGEGLVSLAMGIATMAYAQQVVQWLFP